MKRMFFVFCMLVGSVASSNELLVCQQWGYTPYPEDFHNIKTEPLEYVFNISPNKVTTAIGRVYEVVDPRTVGFENLDIVAYQTPGSDHVLYVYKKGSRTEIGISQLVDDSDALYGDKELFTDCHYKPEGASQGVVASKLSFIVNQGGVSRTVPIYRF